ncbi:MAG TPA: hypothetical protein DEO83_06000 [Lachnospiraceae bacterium]|nr:hypothetical protein [Lachnospiraceae bacterium]
MKNDSNDSIQSEKDKLLAEIRAEFSGEDAAQESLSEDTSDESDTNTDEPTSQKEYTLPSDEELEESINSNPVVMKVSTPLPKYGSGFKYVPIITGITVVAIILGHIKPITYGIPSAAWLRYTYIGFGVLTLIIGIKFIVDALVNCALNENLRMGKLVTTGIYSKTRNPVYGGVLLICTAALFISGNAFMYVLPILYWVLLTKMMQTTEEPMLKLRFKNEYEEYCRKTYRFVPFTKTEEKK